MIQLEHSTDHFLSSESNLEEVEEISNNLYTIQGKDLEI